MYYLAAAAGVVVLAGVLLYWLYRSRRPPRRVPPPPGYESDPEELVRTELVERRRHQRVRSHGTRVLVADAGTGRELGTAAVRDCSASGACLSASRALAPGTRVTVRPADPRPDDLPILMEVRHCEHAGEEWLLGCKFHSAPTAAAVRWLG